MRDLINLIVGSPKLSDRSLVVHLLAKTVVVMVALVVVWALEYQAAVIYEGF